MLSTILVDAILFDLDGTLIDSTPGVVAAWQTWCTKYQLGDFTRIIHNAHGRRLQDSLKEYCGIADEKRLVEEILLFEEEVIRGGPVALPGVKDLIAQLCSHPEIQRKWTIVTSASNEFAPRALERTGIPTPAAGIVTANDVSHGKPHPAPYLAGAALCSAEPVKCLVVEDAISGLVAGRAAGALTLAVCTSTEKTKLIENGKPDYIVHDLTSVSIQIVDDKIQMKLDNLPQIAKYRAILCHQSLVLFFETITFLGVVLFLDRRIGHGEWPIRLLFKYEFIVPFTKQPPFTMQVLCGFIIFIVASCSSARSLPSVFQNRDDFRSENGRQAIALNEKFKTLNADSPCNDGEVACVGGQFAQCSGGKFVLTTCASGTICAAVPLVNSPGTSVVCTTQSDVDSRIASTGANGGGDQKPPISSSSPPAPQPSPQSGDQTPPISSSSPPAPQPSPQSSSDSQPNNNGSNDPQTSLTLDPAVIAQGFANDGQGTPTPGQVASLTSTNNFINFCKNINSPLTNGKQIVDGSCNPAPMGVIPSKDKMPASKFVFPTNGGTVAAKQDFTIQMRIKNLETGNFVNAQQNYFSAPQQLNNQGLIKGHSHVVVQQIPSLDSTDIVDAGTFAFFKGLNDPAQGDVLSADVAGGLPPGVYRLASINTASNHQPVLVPIAQHGSLDDAIYFTVA